MDKETAIAILPLVNNLESMEYLNFYINKRIELLHRNIESESNERTITQIQGKILELRKLQTLKDDVQRILK